MNAETVTQATEAAKSTELVECLFRPKQIIYWVPVGFHDKRVRRVGDNIFPAHILLYINVQWTTHDHGTRTFVLDS